MFRSCALKIYSRTKIFDNKVTNCTWYIAIGSFDRVFYINFIDRLSFHSPQNFSLNSLSLSLSLYHSLSLTHTHTHTLSLSISLSLSLSLCLSLEFTVVSHFAATARYWDLDVMVKAEDLWGPGGSGGVLKLPQLKQSRGAHSGALTRRVTAIQQVGGQHEDVLATLCGCSTVSKQTNDNIS